MKFPLTLLIVFLETIVFGTRTYIFILKCTVNNTVAQNEQDQQKNTSNYEIKKAHYNTKAKLKIFQLLFIIIYSQRADEFHR